MEKRLLLAVVLFFCLRGACALAQDAPTVEPQTVQVSAADRLMLVGDFYAQPGDGENPAVLLLHMLDSSRQAWQPLIPTLLDAGYDVLAVDLRGHGETGGERDWSAAAGDVQTWLDWLRQQPGVRDNAVSIVGASVGADLALVGCGNDPDCATAVALSPVLPFGRLDGWTPEDTASNLSDRPVLVVAAQLDTDSAFTVRHFVQSASGEVGVRIFVGGYHGTYLFGPATRERVIALIVNWLDEHTPE